MAKREQSVKKVEYEDFFIPHSSSLVLSSSFEITSLKNLTKWISTK